MISIPNGSVGHIEEATAYLRSKLDAFSHNLPEAMKMEPFVPRIAIVCGSGLGSLSSSVDSSLSVEYGDIPHFKASTG
jgi:purine-nucleoside phosphorylase